jgi:predicted dehydrogenase
MIKLAIVGLGVMGKNHYRVLKNIGFEVAALCDAVVKEHDGKNVYADYKKMYEEIRPKAVIIVVPTFLHKEVAEFFIEKGVDVFLEKPAADKVEDAIYLSELAQKYGVKTAVGHIERFNPVVRELKRELNGKELYTISITRVGPFPPRIADVGILTDLAVHDIDLIRFLTGSEIKKCSIYKSQKIHDHHEDNAVLSFELENEIVANITTNWLTPFKKRRVEVSAKEGYYDADLMGQDLKEFSSFQANNSYVVRDCIVFKGEPLKFELEAFLSYIKTGDRGDLATIEDSAKTLAILGLNKLN